MRENRLYGSEGREPQLIAAFLPLSIKSQPLGVPLGLATNSVLRIHIEDAVGSICLSRLP